MPAIRLPNQSKLRGMRELLANATGISEILFVFLFRSEAAGHEPTQKESISILAWQLILDICNQCDNFHTFVV